MVILAIWHNFRLEITYKIVLTPGEAIYAATGKSMPMSNSTLLRTNGRGTVNNRHHRAGSGMTSSSSASSNSNNNHERNNRENRESKDDLKDNRPTRLQLQTGKCIFQLIFEFFSFFVVYYICI